MLKQEHGVEITGLYLRTEAIHRFAERELKLKLFPNDEVEPEEESTEEVSPGGVSLKSVIVPPGSAQMLPKKRMFWFGGLAPSTFSRIA